MENEMRRVVEPYFYAANEAVFYDDTVRMTDRAYDLVHDVTSGVLNLWASLRATDRLARSPLWILDVGCGTGAEAMRTLCQIPECRIICVDNSSAMLDQFRRNILRAFGNESADGRLMMVEADVRDHGWLERAIKSADQERAGCTFDAVLSVYALHHLSPDMKLQVYGSIANCLDPGSLFINLPVA